MSAWERYTHIHVYIGQKCDNETRCLYIPAIKTGKSTQQTCICIYACVQYICICWKRPWQLRRPLPLVKLLDAARGSHLRRSAHVNPWSKNFILLSMSTLTEHEGAPVYTGINIIYARVCTSTCDSSTARYRRGAFTSRYLAHKRYRIKMPGCYVYWRKQQ